MAQEKKPKPVTSVRIEWDPEDLPTTYANQLVISHVTGEEFYLVFGEASPPMEMISGRQVEVVKIHPVAKIAIAPSAMIRLASAIQQNVSQFLEVSRGAQEGEDADQPD